MYSKFPNVYVVVGKMVKSNVNSKVHVYISAWGQKTRHPAFPQKLKIRSEGNLQHPFLSNHSIWSYLSWSQPWIDIFYASVLSIVHLPTPPLLPTPPKYLVPTIVPPTPQKQQRTAQFTQLVRSWVCTTFDFGPDHQHSPSNHGIRSYDLCADYKHKLSINTLLPSGALRSPCQHIEPGWLLSHSRLFWTSIGLSSLLRISSLRWISPVTQLRISLLRISRSLSCTRLSWAEDPW